jgi:hypothetical protein
MTASTFPFAAQDPFLMEKKPLDRPWNDSINDGLCRHPLIIQGVMDAQTRKVGMVPKPIHVLRRFARAPWIGANRRIDNEHADIWIRQIESWKVFPGEIDDSDAVGLTYRTKGALPDPHPPSVRDERKLRAFGPQFRILLFD